MKQIVFVNVGRDDPVGADVRIVEEVQDDFVFTKDWIKTFLCEEHEHEEDYSVEGINDWIALGDWYWKDHEVTFKGEEELYIWSVV